MSFICMKLDANDILTEPFGDPDLNELLMSDVERYLMKRILN